MDRAFLLIGCLCGFVGVGLGAFGAHALRSRVTPERLVTFETGVRYLLMHAFAFFAVVAVRTWGPDSSASAVAGIAVALAWEAVPDLRPRRGRPAPPAQRTASNTNDVVSTA